MNITIGKPYLSKQESTSSLCANIQAEEKNFTLWYRVSKEYEDSLCVERADAFLLVLLPWAMLLSTEDAPIEIVCEAPVTERLHHQLTQIYLPLLYANISYYQPVRITADTENSTYPSAHAVGTGISGGVDSSYTLTRFLDCEDKDFRLTHGVYFNMGIYGERNGEMEQRMQRRIKALADSVGLKLIVIESNTCEILYKKAYAPIVPSMFMSAILAVTKLFSVYYYSSTFTANEFYFSEKDAASYDLLNVSCFSTSNTTFYSSGSEVPRLEKLRALTKYPFTYENLSVCLNSDPDRINCGRCAKCTRTMTELETLNKLDLYGRAFDVPSFRSDPGYHWGYVLLKSKSDSFSAETIRTWRAQGKKLPFSAYWSCLKKWIMRGGTAKNPNAVQIARIAQETYRQINGS